MFEVNEYFDGKVKSITFNSIDGDATTGVMAAGEYTFGTSTIELMTVTSGQMQVKLPGSDEWLTYESGDTFRVEANQSFDVKMATDVAYLCVYKNN
ncbi:MAG: pyrimidine/purine nucleoside phosphorylase [gamma proteobacterium symbiont of Bathyaustriella thionipta]|nr:pyrimidine/purine nucleoside phosphorylase [gamma proteobacterium symbiont of Bathyaustriella thionipta]MCU7950839.1 pyrimidine/purine nucleoside phosphorylase [gamma proteobacterium symbiont of Bathyaustriella thionipta]MCU7952285.1 pyrimidine/purine nucleoside phosphorylase [gamma proteobacterium symbiont of Bathyaustriella thionipta]MCU7957361.1 pyrimidine/purine nucleoside phosphorylase [gamma proteobacterium symbiont of Bathyaustriella thionipta]MCU7966730.1 pyrimidine/purine nucleoside